MDNFVITISRQFGSLGRPIAKKMSELLNIEYYDRYIVSKAASQLEMPTDVASDVEETVKRRYINMKFPFLSGTTEMQDDLFETQKKIILDLAEKESCIIVGRCSDYVLRNFKNHMSIYIYAPYYERLKNSIDTLHIPADEAKKLIDEVDESRELYNQHYAHCSSADIHSKDILIDSSILGIEGTAEYLVEFAKRRFSLK